MKYYKSPTNEVFAYESDGSQDSIIPSDYVEITKEEADVLIAESQKQAFDNLPSSEKLQKCKNQATYLLYETDWSTIADVADPTNSPYLTNRDEFIAFRNQVRKLAVDPVEYPTFPPVPKAIWG